MERRRVLAGLLATVAVPALAPALARQCPSIAQFATAEVLDASRVTCTPTGGGFRHAVFYDRYGAFEAVDYSEDGVVEARVWVRGQ